MTTLNKPRIILVSVGTDGDIYPYLALGTELRARGYEAILIAIEPFAGRASEAGIEFLPLMTNSEFEEALHKPEFWHPIKGPIMLARWGARFLHQQYEQFSRLVSQKPSILVANPGLLAARLVH